jgi:hypothetical protein
VRAQSLGDLHRERAHAAAGPMDQHALPRLHLRVVANGLERRAPRDADRRGLLERQVARLRDHAVLASSHVLREGRDRAAEDVVAGLEAGDARTHGDHRPGQVHASHRLALGAHDLRSDLEDRAPVRRVPVERVHRSGAHAHEHATWDQLRHRDLPQVQAVGRAAALLHERLHRRRPLRRPVGHLRHVGHHVHLTAPLPQASM